MGRLGPPQVLAEPALLEPVQLLLRVQRPGLPVRLSRVAVAVAGPAAAAAAGDRDPAAARDVGEAGGADGPEGLQERPVVPRQRRRQVRAQPLRGVAALGGAAAAGLRERPRVALVVGAVGGAVAGGVGDGGRVAEGVRAGLLDDLVVLDFVGVVVAVAPAVVLLLQPARLLRQRAAGVVRLRAGEVAVRAEEQVVGVGPLAQVLELRAEPADGGAAGRRVGAAAERRDADGLAAVRGVEGLDGAVVVGMTEAGAGTGRGRRARPVAAVGAVRAVVPVGAQRLVQRLRPGPAVFGAAAARVAAVRRVVVSDLDQREVRVPVGGGGAVARVELRGRPAGGVGPAAVAAGGGRAAGAGGGVLGVADRGRVS